MLTWAVALALAILAAALIGDLLAEQAGARRGLVLGAGLLTIVPLLLGPLRRFHSWGYALDDRELQVAHGVLTRMHTTVPLGRVQHIDISQGPVERVWGVCRLVLHTAGTMHSRVQLPGLRRADAEAMRDRIRAQIRDEDA